MRNVYSQRLTIIRVSLVLIHEILHGILHEGELDGDTLLDEVQLDTLLDHNLLSLFLYTQGPELIAMLAVSLQPSS